MDDIRDFYSVQNWMETVPQGYLMGTHHGRERSAREPEELLIDPAQREQAILVTVQLVLGERCALAASAGLINATPDDASKRYLATQTLDEARHVEMFTARLFDLGICESDLTDCIKTYGSRSLLRFSDVLLDKVHKGDFLAALLGQNIILEGLSFTVFEALRAYAAPINSKFADSLASAIADERRHVGFGEKMVARLIRLYPARRPELEALQSELCHHVLGVFAEILRNGAPAAPRSAEHRPCAAERQQGRDITGLPTADAEALLTFGVLSDFRQRLGRVGLEYRPPLPS